MDANVAFCASHAPGAGVGGAAAAWHASSGLSILEELKRLPDVTATLQEMEDAYTQESLQTLTANATGREAEWCGSVPALLGGPEWDVGANYANELAALRDFYTLMTGETPPTSLPRRRPCRLSRAPPTRRSWPRA